MALGVAGDERTNVVAPVQVVEERTPCGRAPGHSLFEGGRLYLLDVPGDVHQDGVGLGERRPVRAGRASDTGSVHGDGGLRTRSARLPGQIPADDEAVGPEAVQLAVGVAVHVGHVLVDPRSEPVQVQVGVPSHQGVEGPEHDTDAGFPEQLPLMELQRPADTQVPDFGPDCEHVRPVGQLSVTQARDSVDQAHELPLGIEGAGHHAPHLRRDLEHARRHDVGEAVAPRIQLNGNAFLELGRLGDRADREAGRGVGGTGRIRSGRGVRHLGSPSG